MSNFNSKMSENLLNTLDAIQARDEISKEQTRSFEDQVDKDTGEWLGAPPEGYKPFDAPDIEVKDVDTKVQDFENSDAKTDYIRVRNNTYALQEATMFMLQQAAQLAANTEAPRAFSVFRELGELMRGLNKDLMENQNNFKKVTIGDEPKTDGEGDTEISVETDANGGTRVTVGKTNRRSSRELMEVARRLQAEKEEKDKKYREEQRIIQAEKAKSEAEDAVIVEDNENADDAPAATKAD